MTRLNVFAYTARDSAPAFISINVEEDGRVVMHVREAGKDGNCGAGATVEIPRSEIPDLIRGLSAVQRP